MNKIINLDEHDFLKSISQLKIMDKESLNRLLLREILSERKDLCTYKELQSFSLSQKNNTDYLKYSQHIKESQALIEKLERKSNLCQKQIDMANRKQGEKKVHKELALSVNTSNNLSNTNHSSSFHNDNNDHDNNLTSLPMNTKSLINNYERISISSSDSNLQSKQFPNIPNDKKKKKPSTTKDQSLSHKTILKTEQNVKDSPILFTDIKLRKVGLPPEPEPIQNDCFPPEKHTDFKKPNGQIKINSNVNCSNLRSASIDSGAQNCKDKFYNPNKEIQTAIQNELKAVKLKKINTNVTSPTVNCSIDNMSIGKYNFVNEKSMTNSVSTPMSASSSMPFLNSICSEQNSYDDNDSSSQTSVPSCVMDEKSLESDNASFKNIDFSSITNWNPLTLLKKLYDFENQLKVEVPMDVKKDISSLSGFIDILPGLSNSSLNKSLWKRRYASMSNGEMKIFENSVSRSPLSVFDVNAITIKKCNEETIELYDSKGLHSTIKFPKSVDCAQWVNCLKANSSHQTREIIPRLYESINSENVSKMLIVDIGSCSIRAGLLKSEPTVPKLYFPNIAAISKASETVYEVGFEAVDLNTNNEYYIIRPLKPDTTIDPLAFTSGVMEFTFKKILSQLNITSNDYVIILCLPHNISEATKAKLADLLLLRMNFKGVSMFGQSWSALHSYGVPTGILVDIGHRTEILPVIHGVVHNSAITRGLYGGHLTQIALSHLLPFPLTSLTDFLLVRYIMEKACFVAPSLEKAKGSKENIRLNLDGFNLPSQIPRSLSLSGQDRCLPVEGIFSPDVYSLDVPSLPKLIFKSIQNCPVDNRRDLYQSIYLSGAATLFPGFCIRLELELKKLVPSNCEVKVHCSHNRAHFSYVGACFVALSERFKTNIVNKQEWEKSRGAAFKKWCC